MQTSLRDIVTDAVKHEPKRLRDIYAIVGSIRPGTADETVRARIYESVSAGTILRVCPGVYLASSGPARMVLIEGDAWDIIKTMPNDTINLIVTDPPFDMGTAANARTGSTRPHGQQGRTYEQRDLDASFLKEAFRVLAKTTHEWASIAPRSCAACKTKVDAKSLNTSPASEATAGHCATCGKTTSLTPYEPPMGPGVACILTPPRTEQTDPHIDELKRIAKTVGFHFVCEFAIDYQDKAMGYWPPQRHWLVHAFTAGPVKRGVPHDLSVTSCFTVKRVRRASKPGTTEAKDEHEAEKPVELFETIARFFTKPGDIITDFFGGRARWAQKLVNDGRHVVLIEKDPHWVERIASDWRPAPEASP